MGGISCFFLRRRRLAGSRAGLGPWKRRHDLKLPVDAHPCSAPADSALHRLTEAAYAICIASMVSAAP